MRNTLLSATFDTVNCHQPVSKAERPNPSQFVKTAPASSSDSVNDDFSKPGKIKFRVAGREFTLRQRIAGKFAPWYLVATLNGKRFNHSLGTNEEETAKQVARVKFIQPALDEAWGMMVSDTKRKQWGTVEELIAEWEGFDLGGGPRHRRTVEKALRLVLQSASSFFEARRTNK